MKRDLDLHANYHREGDPKSENPRARLHVDTTGIAIMTDTGMASIDAEDWPAVLAEIERMLATREHFLKGEAA